MQLGMSPVSARQSEWQATEHLQARLISARESVAQDEFIAAIDVRLSHGWYGYWKMPGEGGLPPSFDWSESENLQSAEVLWPLPVRHVVADMHSFIYKSSMLLPVRVVPKDGSKKVVLRAASEIMICNDICIPQRVNLHLEIPAGDGEKSAVASQIEYVVENLPAKENTGALKIEHLVIGPKALVITTYAKRGYDDADVYIDSGDIYLTAPPVIEKDEKDARKAIISITYPPFMEGVQKDLMSSPVSIVFTDGTDAIEREFSF